MNSDPSVKEVRFDKWCPSCKNWKDGRELRIGVTDPKEAASLAICDECLETGMREGTEKPEKWEAK